MKRQRLVVPACLALAFFGAGSRLRAATVVVNDNGDTVHSPGCATTGTGTCTLRDAITFANANAGSIVNFGIPGAGAHTIALGTNPLPNISAAVTINGFSQSGASANTHGTGQGDNSVHLIEIDGTNLTGGYFACLAFVAGSGGSLVKGLAINRCKGAGISVVGVSGGIVIEGDFLGTDPTGTVAHGNGLYGVIMDGGSTGVTVGGTAPAARNLISANAIAGIGFGNDSAAGGSGHLIQGNFIGTNAAGTASLGGGQTGVSMAYGVSNTTVGGTTAAARNVISGNGSRGIILSNSVDNAAVTNNTIEGNYIGTDLTGMAAVGNQQGIGLYGVGNTIGGAGAGEGNVISANGGIGIDVGGHGNAILGNKIGTDVTGTGALGNSQAAIAISVSQTTIGGTGVGAGNVIAFNGNPSRGGILVEGTGNTIRGNSIFSNYRVGIDLASDGPTLNDSGDADTGANNLQNFPVITSVTASAINGTLNSKASTTYHLDFYASPACDDTGFGEGKTYLGSLDQTTNGSGNLSFSAAFAVPSGQIATATATDPSGNTSEFSQCAFVFPQALTVDPTPSAGSDGNGVLEPGETAVVQPFWKNPTAADMPGITGTASGVTGPGGATYNLTDTASTYGTAMAGQPSSCSFFNDCYTVFVSDPATRPAAHWDASFSEALHVPGLPDSVKNWKLHLGDSFTDVPRNYLFYNKIETVYHNAITVGCTTAAYCPTDKVNRAQMAIFLARGIAHGGANVPVSGSIGGKPYNCVAGGKSLFTDVNPTDIACKSIHYIAAQNVTTGCATGLYCPGDNVSRSQMSIFVAKAIVAPAGGPGVPMAYGPDPVTGLSYSCDAGSPNLHFTDIAVADSFCKHAHFLWAKGIIAGCSFSEYCPTGDVGRDEMAKFLANAFQLTLYGVSP